MIHKVIDYVFGEKVANSKTRHRPSWLPKHFDKRWFNGKLAVMDLPPYKPPYRRYINLKAWIDTDVYHRVVMIEVDFDKRDVSIETYK